jgi:hypothetical protein
MTLIPCFAIAMIALVAIAVSAVGWLSLSEPGTDDPAASPDRPRSNRGWPPANCVLCPHPGKWRTLPPFHGLAAVK